jgi:hypothetical protein
MSALRHLRKTLHKKLRWRDLPCSRCKLETKPADLLCEECANEKADEAVEEDRDSRDKGIEMDAQRDLARVWLDIRHGRQKDAIERLERALDDVAPSWRGLA